MTLDLASRLNAPDTNCRVAQAWTQLGCAIVPWHYEVTPGGKKVKKPSIRGWRKGAAFTTAQQCVDWWTENPHDYPGIVTGELSGIWVLDLDRKNGADGVAELRNLLVQYTNDARLPPGPLRVETPSGGWHVYFKRDPQLRNSQGEIAPGIDVRAEGGYVAAPGTVTVNGEYSAPTTFDGWFEAPEWLLNLARQASTRSLTGSWDGEYRGTASSIDQLAAAAPGQQDQALFDYLKDQHQHAVEPAVALRAAWEVVQRWPLSDPDWPWTYEDVQAKVEHVYANEQYRGIAVLPPEIQAFLARTAAVPPSDEVAAMDRLEVEAVVASQVGAPHDRANARALAAFAADRLRIVGKDDWLVWDGRRWVFDEKFARFGIVEELAASLLLQAARPGVGLEEKEVLMKRAYRLYMNPGRDAALNAARDLLAVTQEELDPDHYVLNCLNGLLDLRTGELRPARPEDLVTKLVQAEYDPAARDPIWERVLAELIDEEGDRSWLQKWFGYCLTGDTTEKAICCLHGPRDSGKSTISETLLHVLGLTAAGGYGISWTADVIEHRSQVNRGEKLSQLNNARLVTCAELSQNAYMATSFVKELTGGDTIDSKALFKASRSIRPRCKLLMHTNHIPRSADQALQQRLRFVHLTRALSHEEKDRSIKVHLEQSTAARAAVLAWAVEGAKRWFAEGLGMPARQEEELAAFRRDSDYLVEFVEECVTSTDDKTLWPTKEAMRAAFDGWCAESGNPPLKPRAFKNGLLEQGLQFERVLMDGRLKSVWIDVQVKWEPDVAALSERVATLGGEPSEDD